MSKKMKMDWKEFEILLEDEYSFPCDYQFKFIVPTSKEQEARLILKEENLTLKKSSKGRYTAFTKIRRVNTSQDIISTYKAMIKIEGVVSL